MSGKLIGVVVDDDPDFLEVVHRILERAWPDGEVLTFSDSMEAFAFITRTHIDLLVTDVQMPILDGLGLTAAIRVSDTRLPIIVMSGEDRKQAALAHGASVFLEKGSLLAQLGAVVSELVSGAKI